MPDDHFWREAQAGSACLCPQLARRLPGQTGGRTFARGVALVANRRVRARIGYERVSLLDLSGDVRLQG